MDSLLFVGRIGSGELLLIFLVFIVLFGAKRIPEFAKMLGKGIREFRNAAKELTEELDERPKEKKDG